MIYRKVLNKISPYKPGLSEEDIKKENNIEKVVKLASNENSYGSPKKVQELLSNMQKIERYPDNYCTKLRNLLAKKFNIAEEKLIFGNGSVEIIQMISRILIEKDDEIITCNPTFQSYFLEALIQNGKIVTTPILSNYKFDLDGILKKINKKTKIIYIANPNNPTGTIVENEELIKFLNKVPEQILVVLDEAYAEFVNNTNYPNSIELLNTYKNICILKTFSKAYGLASLRIGYGIADESIISQLEKVRVPFNVSTIAQQAAIVALKDTEFLKQCINKNRDAIEYTYKKLNEYNIKYIKTETNFIMIDTENDSNVISEKLQQKGFIVRPNFPSMESYIRVTIGTKEEMKQFIECLKNIMK